MKYKALGGAIACALFLAGSVPSAQSNNTVTAPFSDASRAGTVKVSVIRGSITVRAGAARDVTITTPARPDQDRDNARGRGRNNALPPGMHRLTQPTGVRVEEENNVMTVSTSPGEDSDLELQVPAATSLVLRAVNGGEILVERVNGSIEATNINGKITLSDVGGTVVAHATNGAVVATLREVTAGTPMSFTSLNGSVDVTLPASTKASLKLRSDRGNVYTDFDVQTSQPPAPAAAPAAGAGRDSQRSADRDRNRSRLRVEIDRSVYGTINGGGPDFELRTFNGNVYLRKAK